MSNPIKTSILKASELEMRLRKTLKESIPAIADYYIAENKGETSITAKRLQSAFKTYVADNVALNSDGVFPKYYNDFRDNKLTLRKCLYAKYLENTDGVRKRVILTGPTASGKTTFQEKHPYGKLISNDKTILFDEYAISDKNDFRCAENIKKPLEVVCVYRDVLCCAEAYAVRFLAEQRFKTIRNISLEKRAKDFVDSHIKKLETFLDLPSDRKGGIYYNSAPLRTVDMGNERQHAFRSPLKNVGNRLGAAPQKRLALQPTRPLRNMSISPAPLAKSVVKGGDVDVPGIEPERYYAKHTEKDISRYVENLKAHRAVYEKAVFDVFQKYSQSVFQKQEMFSQAKGR